jgi:hypothetical protein
MNSDPPLIHRNQVFSGPAFASIAMQRDLVASGRGLSSTIARDTIAPGVTSEGVTPQKCGVSLFRRSIRSTVDPPKRALLSAPLIVAAVARARRVRA